MKAKIKVKSSAIGVSVGTKSIGVITVAQRHVDILAREGRFDLLDGIVPAKKLVALSDKTVKELREIAKGLDGYELKLKKDELIELINDSPSA